MILVSVFALWLASQQAVPPEAPPPIPESQKAAFIALLREAPAFAKATGRELGAVRLGMVAPGSEGKAFIVEFGWKEKGAPHTGIATLGDEAAVREHNPDALAKAIARRGGWVLVAVHEDMTWDDLIAGLRNARRSGVEAMASGDVRSVIAAQGIYQSVVHAYAPTIACLARPADCISGYTGPSDFVNGYTAKGEDFGGYRRALHAGRKAARPVPATARAVETWAYTVVPSSRMAGGAPSAGDHTGVVCAVAGGVMPPITNGTCPKTCQPLP